MNLTTGALSPTDISAAPPIPERVWVLLGDARIAEAGPTQYESSDRRHIMSSERIGDDKTWAKYRWTVFERATRRRVGAFETHLAFSPFAVRDSTLVYETTPYIRGGRAEPAKLRGVNLTSGQEVWSVEVRELAYRGPYPP